MNLVKSFITNNPYYQNNVNKKNSTYTNFQKNGPSGLMLHSVGTPQPNASVFIKAWNNSSYTRACVHGFIDANTGTIYQTLPWNYRAAHAGIAYGNEHYVGVEMCEPSEIKYISGSSFSVLNATKAKAAATRTYNAAVELFAMLCKTYNLNPLTAICSHKEGHTIGIASNHGDPEHLWKGLGLSYTMNTFRADVKAKMSGTIATTTTNTTGGNAYKVRVTASKLNVRSGPGVMFAIVTQIVKGDVYTIVEESGGWGKLKSGVGWISLNYTQKI